MVTPMEVTVFTMDGAGVTVPIEGVSHIVVLDVAILVVGIGVAFVTATVTDVTAIDVGDVVLVEGLGTVIAHKEA